MSASAYSTVSFDENGERSDRAFLSESETWSEDDDEDDHLDIVKTTVRLSDGHGGVEGEVESGHFWWRCFIVYAERTPDSAMMVLATCGSRALLAVTVPGDVSEAHVATLVGEFLDRACKVVDFDATMMRAGLTADESTEASAQ
jgi:hypothetical protein